MNACSHGNTVVYSVSLVIDKCLLCGGFLIWCESARHADTRHWHFVESERDARTLAMDGKLPQGNIYGIKRPAESGRGSLR